MSALDNDDLKWLMEQSHNAYLSWIGLWLVCLLGIVNILISVPTIAGDYRNVVYALYWGLVVGMLFAVYRVCNILSHHIGWAREIKNANFKKEVFNHRGTLSRFIVDDQGIIHRWRQLLVFIIHFGLGLLLFLLAHELIP